MRFKEYIFVIATLLLLAGCTTTEKFSVYAPNGTKIYTANNTVTAKGVVSDSRKVNIEVPSDMYCGYILAQSPGSNVIIPIGLDYKTKRHNGTKAALYTGATLTSVGMGAVVIGGTAMLLAASNGDDDASSDLGMIVGIGGAVAGVGAAFGAPAESRLNQTAYDYNFGYEKQQRINLPHLSNTLLSPNKPKDYRPEVTDNNMFSSRRKASSGKDVTPETKSNSLEQSSKVNKNRSDYSKNIEGTYSGTGTLLWGKSIEEKYNSIRVVIKRKDRNHVLVNIIECGENYFDSPIEYIVNTNKNGGYDLVVNKLPEAVIHISNTGKLIFNHKKVNIDDIIYTLDIKANKNQ